MKNTKTKKTKGRKGQKIKRQSAPVSIGSRLSSRSPQIRAGPNGSVRVKHRELISDILGAVEWTTLGMAINPGLAAVFPWLSSLAVRYESYIMHGLEFLYETIRSTATDGLVTLAVDYDAADHAPATKVDLMAHQGAVRSSPWQSSRLRAARAALQKRKTYYVRSTEIDVKEDIKTYDCGNVFVGTQGMADNTQVGELYVEYDVQFLTPVLDSTASQAKALSMWSPGPRYVNGNFAEMGANAGPFGRILEQPSSAETQYQDVQHFRLGNSKTYDVWVNPDPQGGWSFTDLNFRDIGEYRVTLTSFYSPDSTPQSQANFDVHAVNCEVFIAPSPTPTALWGNTTSGGTYDMFIKTYLANATLRVYPGLGTLGVFVPCNAPAGVADIDNPYTTIYVSEFPYGLAQPAQDTSVVIDGLSKIVGGKYKTTRPARKGGIVVKPNHYYSLNDGKPTIRPQPASYRPKLRSRPAAASRNDGPSPHPGYIKV